MSSIAYITDHDMIEYHRLHGNKNIAFWRPSSQKGFQHFHIGDYLFFLTKGTEKGKEREKGIIGYGRFYRESVCSVSQAWKKYGTMCGYGTLPQFKQAVISVNKAHELPKQIHCLLLERVIFFQAPIYLSEFSINISKQIESYIYLNQDQPDIDLRLLEKAMHIGTDMWNNFGEDGTIALNQDKAVMAMQSLHGEMPTDCYSAHERKKMQSFAQGEVNRIGGSFLSRGKDDYILWEKEDICLFIPCVMSLKHWKRGLMFSIAKAQLYQGIIKEKKAKAKVSIMMDEINEHAIRLCQMADIAYQIKEKA